MKKEVLDYVVEKTNDLINAASCSKEAKEAANAWLAAVGTDKEAEATKAYIAELEEDIMPLDNLIAFAESDMGACGESKGRCGSRKRNQGRRSKIL